MKLYAQSLLASSTARSRARRNRDAPGTQPHPRARRRTKSSKSPTMQMRRCLPLTTVSTPPHRALIPATRRTAMATNRSRLPPSSGSRAAGRRGRPLPQHENSAAPRKRPLLRSALADTALRGRELACTLSLMGGRGLRLRPSCTLERASPRGVTDRPPRDGPQASSGARGRRTRLDGLTVRPRRRTRTNRTPRARRRT